MVRSKPGPSKKPKRGVDFKKIKRKIGRKLPPPRNFTDTQIKSKSIILPEQSVASDRAGLAVNKKGLTLRELLQQTSHHNAKIRKAALAGIKDLILKHPLELKQHKLAIIEKLRERICDTDRAVRDALYQLLETDIFPCLKEDMSAPIISLLMAYVFNAMTHMAVDIRLMAFKFFNLIVQSFPSSFILYADKVLDNYTDILRNNHIYLQDRGKFKNVLNGLICCMSSLDRRKGEKNPSNESNIVNQKRLHAFESAMYKDDTGTISIVKKLEDLVPILVNCFRESTSLVRAEPVFDAQSFDCMLKTVECIYLMVKVLVNESHYTLACSRLLPISLFHGPNGRNTIFAHLSKLWESFPIGKMHSSTDKENERYFTLNARIIEIFLQLADWIHDRGTIEKFLEFIESSFESLLPGQGGSRLLSNKSLLEKHFCPVVLFIPRLVSQITDEWRARLLKAFTGAYMHCKVESKLCLAYLSAVEELLLSVKSDSDMSVKSSFSDMLVYQVTWIQHLPNMLLQLRDKDPSVTKVVLKLILRIGQWSQQNSPIALEYDRLQLSLKGFYCDRGVTTNYGSFMKLPRDCQELALCSLYYMSSLSSDLLQSLTSCCLSDDMEPFMLLRIVEVLHSAYKAGHVHISDHIAFLVTVLANKVFPEKFCIIESNGRVSSRGTSKSLSTAVSSCLSQMGDSSLVQKLLFKDIFGEMSKKLPVDNMYGLLRVTVSLDARLTKLSPEDIASLSNWLFVYLIDTASHVLEPVGATVDPDQMRIFRYYIQPCIFLFNGSDKLLCHVLKFFDSSIIEGSLPADAHALNPFGRLHVTCSILFFMHNDVRLHGRLSLCKGIITNIVHNVQGILESSKCALTLEEKHSIQILVQQLKSKACRIQCSDARSLE